MSWTLRHGGSSRGGVSSRSGFTLIEVLLSTFILSLGVLGLLALFAGAARQQQASVETTSAFITSQNAEAALEQAFGALVPNTGTAAFPPGIWTRLSMNRRFHYLTVNPRGSSNGPYFLVPPTSQLPLSIYTHFDAAGSFADSPQNCYDTGFAFGAADSTSFTAASDIGQRRIEKDSLQITVYLSRWQDINGDGMIDDSDERVFLQPQVFERLPVDYASDPSDPNDSVYIYPLRGSEQHDPLFAGNAGQFQLPPDTISYIRVDLQLAPGGTTNASIVEMRFGDIRDECNGFIDASTASPTSWEAGRVERIEINDYRWLNDQLVSLNDRVITKPQVQSNGDVVDRAEQAYSVAFRPSGAGFQAVIATYQLLPTAATGDWIPPEREEDVEANVSPLRRADLALYYDADLDEYYFRSTAEFRWAVEPGQVLLVEGNPNVLGQIGADQPVRVVRQIREVPELGGQYRGYLDRQPRANNRGMLPTAFRRAGTGVLLRVLAIADTARSTSDDQAVWKLKPLDMRVIQVPLGN